MFSNAFNVQFGVQDKCGSEDRRDSAESLGNVANSVVDVEVRTVSVNPAGTDEFAEL